MQLNESAYWIISFHTDYPHLLHKLSQQTIYNNKRGVRHMQLCGMRATYENTVDSQKIVLSKFCEFTKNRFLRFF